MVAQPGVHGMSGTPEWQALSAPPALGSSPRKEVTLLRRQLEALMAGVQDQSVAGLWLDFVGKREPVFIPAPAAKWNSWVLG